MPAQTWLPTREGVTPWWQRSSLIYAACFAFLLLVLLTVLKQVYLWSDDRSPTVLNRGNLLWDDGGFYASVIATTGEGSALREQEWFRYAQRELTSTQLFLEWGHYASRIKAIFSPYPQTNLYLRFAALLERWTGDYAEAFYAAMNLYPLLVLLKYLVLICVLRQRGRQGLLWAVLLVDFSTTSHVFFWFTSEAYAWQFFTLGIFLRLFTRNAVPACACLAVAALSSAIVLVSALAFGVADLSWRLRGRIPFLERLFELVFSRYLPLFLVLAALPFALSVPSLYFGVKEHHYLSECRTLILHNLDYLSPLIIASAYAAAMSSRRQPRGKLRVDSLSGRLMSAALLTLLAASAVVLGALAHLAANFGSFEFVLNANRHAPYVFGLLLATCVVNGWLARRRPGDVMRRRGVALAAVVGVMSGIDNYLPTLSTVPDVVPFASEDFPALRVDERSGCSYFLASNPQQVYGYFLRGDFESHPLVFDLRTAPYVADEAVARICATSPAPGSAE